MATTNRPRRPIPTSIRPGRLRGRGRELTEPTAAEANVQIIEHNGLRWLDIRRPTAQTMEYLRDEFQFHPLALEDVTSRLQRPKLDVYDEYLFLVVHFPVHNKVTRSTSAAEVDIFVGHDYLISVHDGQLKPLVRMFDSALETAEARDALMGRSAGHLLYYVVDRLVDYCVPVVSKLAENVERIEEMIFKESGQATVQEISIVRRDLIALRRIIKPQMGVVGQLEHRRLPFVEEDIDVYFGDILDQLSQIWDTLEDQKEVLEGLSSTFDSLASHRLNEVIKTLTVISVIILPLTLISGVFGMNVPIPYETSGYALAIITAFMLLTIVTMLLVFRRRRWL